MRDDMKQHFELSNYRYILDEEGNAILCPDLFTWGEWMERSWEIAGPGSRRVARTEFWWGAVSTVFLGLDHSFEPDDTPLLFETMVFGSPFDGDQMRYSTRTEALNGHRATLNMIANLTWVDWLWWYAGRGWNAARSWLRDQRDELRVIIMGGKR